MTRLDYAAMASCYGLVGSAAWAMFTGNLWPLGIALAFTLGCTLVDEALKGRKV